MQVINKNHRHHLLLKPKALRSLSTYVIAMQNTIGLLDYRLLVIINLIYDEICDRPLISY